MSLRARVALRRGDLDLDVDLVVADREVLALLGPNGAGKTTVLRALAGLLAVASGRVEVGGVAWEDPARGLRLEAPARRVGVVFQDLLLFPHLDALGNVAFGLRARGVPRVDADEVARGWLERMQLGHRAGDRPASLSGGEAQRVALARALAADPDLLLLDEPMAALDASARAGVRAELRRHLEGFAGPTVLVTHDPLDALLLADRIAVLEGGRIVQDGAAAEVAARPRSPWAAQLLGLNLYRGTADGGVVALEGGGRLAAASARSGPVFAVVRPAAVALHRHEPSGSPRNRWRMEVRSIEAAGERVRVALEGDLALVAEVTPAAVAELRLGSGPVWAAVKATEVDLYPA